MKIRTLDNLQDIVDQEYAWRRKELSIIKGNVATAKGKTINLAIRAGVALLYAHWEGFIKNTAEYYLEYVSYQKIAYKDLAPNFIALRLKYQLHACEETNKSSIHTQVVDFILNGLAERSRIPFENVINTSNLKSEILQEIILKIGLDYSLFETKSKLIDERLVNHRNKIAHGEFLIITDTDYFELFDEIVGLINLFKNEVLNAAAQKKYLKQAI